MSLPTLTLADFLLARIGEDEAVALEAAWRFAEHTATTEAATEHIARWDPARVLAECDAKRRIVQGYLHEVRDYRAGYTNVQPSHKTVKHLALPYADHPDYRDEWKP